jgi:hypothetical protein
MDLERLVLKEIQIGISALDLEIQAELELHVALKSFNE